MRPESPLGAAHGVRGRAASKPRPAKADTRKTRRRVALEALEPRALMAVLPAPVVATAAKPVFDDTNNSGDVIAPSIAINPANANQIVSVFTVHDTNFNAGRTPYEVKGEFSTDGGATWHAFDPTGNVGVQNEPANTTPTPFAAVTDGGVSWDRQGNFYVIQEQHSGDYHAGEIFVSRYTLSGASAVDKGDTQVDSWNTSGSPTPFGTVAYQPTIAADGNLATFTDGAKTQADSFTANAAVDGKGNAFTAGNVYVAWVNDTPPPTNPPSPWNRYTLEMETSTDGAQTFPTVLSPGDGNVSNSHDASPKLTVSQGTGDGRVAGGQVTLIYDDFGGGPNVDGGLPVDLIRARAITGGGTTLGTISTAAITTVRGPVGGAPTGANSVASAAAPQLGIGPGASIASDNTLGSFSQFQGRIYVAYTGRYSSASTVPGSLFVGGEASTNEADNTDVFLRFSDDGGKTWTQSASTPDLLAFPLSINDDSGPDDGYSAANQILSGKANGRPQFEPSVAVDPDTGIVAVSFYDARYDASRTRVAMTVATSIDGGVSYSQQNQAGYANVPQAVTDTVTGNRVILGPIPDNQSTNTDATFGFGAHQGLAIIDGKIYPAWAGNFNGSTYASGRSGTGQDGNNRTDLIVAKLTTASGPRVVASTMGPVGEPGDQINPQRAADGSPEASGFVLEFDRPIDPATFTTATVKVQYRDTSGIVPALQPTVWKITALNANAIGATQFFVQFGLPVQGQPGVFVGDSRVGTYSYSIGPNTIADRVRTPTANGFFMDQSGRARGAAAGTNADTYADPKPLAATNNPFAGPFDATTLPLIVPGLHVVDTGTPVTLDGSVASVVVTFDRDLATDSKGNLTGFPASQVISITGPDGPISGPFTVTAVAGHPAEAQINFPAQAINGTYAIQLGPGIKSASGVFMDTNLNAGLDILRGKTTSAGTVVTAILRSTDVPKAVGTAAGTVDSQIVVTDPTTSLLSHLTLQLNISYTNDPDLTAVLKKIDPLTGLTVINPTTGLPESAVLFGGNFPVGQTGTGTGFQDTIFDDTATTPISNGGRPFFSTFNPQQPLDAAFAGDTPAGTYVLELTSAGNGSGTLNNWAITYKTTTPGTGLAEPVADQTSLRFRVFNLDPTQAIGNSTWTALGPSGIGAAGEDLNGQTAGRVTAVAVDPSDPSGNTVYAAGASGGVWKTTDFLTNSPSGPTWVPLTDFGSDFAADVGSITVIPRNNDPSQSIIIAATGEGDALGQTSAGQASQKGLTAQGVGFLRSMDGGKTWTLLDSTDNTTLPYADRDHIFAVGSGTTAFRIASDPKALPGGGYILYAALSDVDGSGRAGGIWRSLDTGQTWQRLLVGQATDLTLDLNSGTGAPNGNLQTVDAALEGQGVFVSNNRGQDWRQMTGGLGDPLIRDQESTGTVPTQVTVQAPGGTPNGAKGRITLARPSLTGVANADKLYQGWLYAAVATTDGNFDGLYVTKDFGQNWTKVALPVSNGSPSNDFSLGTVADPSGGEANFALSLAVDPANPNVVYLGSGTVNGGSVLRVDTTGIADPYAFYLSNFNPGGATTTSSSTGPVRENTPATARKPPPMDFYSPASTPFLNMVVDPNNPFGTNATILVSNTNAGSGFSNTGGNIKFVSFEEGTEPDPYNTGDFNSTLATRVQNQIVTLTDPLTGKARLIFADDQGIYSAVDRGDGTLIGSLGDVELGAFNALDTNGGDVPIPTGSRVGNLQVAQMFSAAAQPSNSAVARAALGGAIYGVTYQAGQPESNSNEVNDTAAGSGYGDISWDSPIVGAGISAIDQRLGTGSDIATDPTGSGNVYDFTWPATLIDQIQTGANDPNGPIGQVSPSDFFQVNAQGRTLGLFAGGTTWPNFAGSNFTVNQINGQQILVGSPDGHVFRTENGGQFWSIAADPNNLDGSYAQALAFGAPDPNGPGGIGNLDNLLYAGTVGGHIFVSQTGGGGGAANAWTDISNGLDGSPVAEIVADPDRGSHAAYAVTSGGVSVSVPNDPVPTPAAGQQPENVLSPTQGVAIETATVKKNILASHVTATVNISWPKDGLLTIRLIAPDGTSYLLASGVGGNNANFTNTTFDDQQELNPIATTGAAPFTGSFAPGANGSPTWISDRYHSITVSTDIYGKSITGKWTLQVTGGDGTSSGQINNWSLNYTSLGGVFFNPDTTGGGGWQTVSSNAYRIAAPEFGSATQSDTLIRSLDSVVADWRYAIPNDFSNPAAGTHPMLYVAGQGGVLRSIDGGKSWTSYPTIDPTTLTSTPTPPGNGGGLPVSDVTSLTLTSGNIDPNTGRPVPQANDPDLLLASTYGRGAFGILLAPEAFSASLELDPGTPGTPGGSDSGNSSTAVNPAGVVPADQLDHVTDVNRPTIDGFSEISAFGSSVLISLYDVTDPAHPVWIGGYNPATQTVAQAVAAGQFTTDAAGHFAVPVSVPLSDGPHRIGIQATDQAGAQGTIALLPGTDRTRALAPAPTGQPDFSIIVDTTPPAIPPAPDLEAASDSGISGTDNVTQNTSLTFDIGSAANPVEPLARLDLFRDGVLVATLMDVAGGIVPITDPGPVPQGLHLYTVLQTDLAANPASDVSAALSVTVDTTPPGQAPAPDLTAASDTGTSNADNVTNVTSPTFDVSGVEVGASLQLLRDGVVVATLNNTAGGTVAISDPGPVSPDGTYTYTAEQLDAAGNSGPVSGGLAVTFDTSPPAAPSAPDLEPTSDSGLSNTDNITQVTTPVFDVSGVEAGATLRLFRGATLVATLTDTPGGTISIQDPSVSDGTYTYTADQVDLGGNASPMGPGLTVTIATAAPLVLNAPDLEAKSDSGISSTDNVTSATIIHFPVFDISTVSPAVTVELFRNGVLVNSLFTGVGGTVAITDPQQPFNDGLYVYTAEQVDQSGNASPMSPALLVTIDDTPPASPSAPDLEASSDSGLSSSDNITKVNKPVFDVSNVEQGSTLQLLRNGTVVATITNAPAGTVPIQDVGPSGAGVPDGVYVYTAILTDVAGNSSPIGGGLTVTIRTAPPTVVPSVPDLQSTSDSGSSNVDNITNVTSPTFDVNSAESLVLVQLLRNGAVVATRSGPGSLTDPGPVRPDGVYNYTAREVDLAGNIGPVSAALAVTFDTVALATSPPFLEPASDSGTVGDGITKINKPTFDVAPAEAGAVVQLLRNGVVVAVRVGSGPLTDNGPTGAGVPDGTYTYTAQQIDVAGNTSPASAGTSVTIDTTIGLPGVPDLEAASDSGRSSTDNYTSVTHPVFDIAPAEAGATVELLRDGVVVATRTGPGALTDDGPGGAGVPTGTHLYTSQQVDAAGNTSAPSAGLSVTIATALAQPPIADLVAASDSGRSSTDNVTNVTRPVFDLTASLAGETLTLFRNGALVGSRVGTGSITDNGPSGGGLADGSYSYTVIGSDPAGNTSPQSPALSVTIDTTPPAAPPAPILAAASDSGAAGDGITNVTNPTFTVNAGDQTASAQLLRKVAGAGNATYVPVGSPVVGSGTVSDSGLADGSYTYAARISDAAGNQSPVGASVNLTVDTVPPAAPTVALDPTSDTGTVGDGVTSSRLPSFSGVAEKGAKVTLYNIFTGHSVGSAVASALNGSYTIKTTVPQPDGTFAVEGQAVDPAGNVGPLGAIVSVKIVTVTGDYDGDGKADPVAYRPGPASTWTIANAAGATSTTSFGTAGDVPIEGDFDGDGKADIGVYRPSTGQWLILESTAGPTLVPFGGPGDIPIPADYDGDGKTDVGVYRPSTGQWLLLESTAWPTVVTFGGSTDIPEPADYDGDGRADVAIFRPTTGQWAILQSTAGPRLAALGGPGDQPVAADYDGDGKADIAVFRPSTAQWLILQSTAGPKAVTFGGVNLDVPAPLDYDGDGKADLAVFRPSTSQYLILQSTAGPRVQSVGPALGGIAVPAPYSFRSSSQVASRSIGGGGAADIALPATAAPAVVAPTGPSSQSLSAAPQGTLWRLVVRQRPTAGAVRVVHQEPEAASPTQHDAAIEALLQSRSHRRGRPIG